MARGDLSVLASGVGLQGLWHLEPGCGRPLGLLGR